MGTQRYCFGRHSQRESPFCFWFSMVELGLLNVPLMKLLPVVTLARHVQIGATESLDLGSVPTRRYKNNSCNYRLVPVPVTVLVAPSLDTSDQCVGAIDSRYVVHSHNATGHVGTAYSNRSVGPESTARVCTYCDARWASHQGKEQWKWKCSRSQRDHSKIIQ